MGYCSICLLLTLLPEGASVFHKHILLQRHTLEAMFSEEKEKLMAEMLSMARGELDDQKVGAEIVGEIVHLVHPF